MRRVVIELPANDLAELLDEPSLDKLESFEALSFLRVTPKEVVLVGRVKFKDPLLRPEEIFTEPSDEVQVLERDKDGTYTCFMKGKLQREFSGVFGAIRDGYLSYPYELKDGHLKVALLGSQKVIRGFLRTVEEAGVRYKLVSLTDARFSSNSPLGSLTLKQQSVIISAFKLGYYDSPRKTSSRELAEKLHIREPTLVRHRRKAERRILSEVLGES